MTDPIDRDMKPENTIDAIAAPQCLACASDARGLACMAVAAPGGDMFSDVEDLRSHSDTAAIARD